MCVKYLDKIGSAFFGVKPVREGGDPNSVNPSEGGLGGIISNLLGAVTSGASPATGGEAASESEGIGGFLGSILGGGGMPSETAADSRSMPPLGGLMSLFGGGGGPGSEEGSGFLGMLDVLMKER